MPPSPGSIDLSAQPMPSGSMRSDELILERFTRESEQLAKQAQPTADLARNLKSMSDEFGRMRIEVSRLGETFTVFSNHFREGIARMMEGIRTGSMQGGRFGVSGGMGGMGGFAGPAVASIVTAATIASIQRNVQSVMPPSSTGARQQEIVGRSVLTGAQTQAQIEAQKKGGNLGVINTGTEEQIKALNLKNIGPSRLAQMLELRKIKEFESPEDVVSRLKIGDPTKGQGAETIESIEGKDIGKRKAPTMRQQSIAASQDAIDALEKEIKLLEEKEAFDKSPTGVENRKKLADAQNRLNQVTRQANWQQQVKDMGAFNAYLGFIDEKAQKVFTVFRDIGQAGKMVFAAGTGMIASTAAVADPVEWQTFKRSIEGVAASIGTVFGPVLLELSGYLQDAADWFRNLDDSSKTVFGRFVLGAVAIGGLVAVGGRLIPVLWNIGVAALAGAAKLDVFFGSTAKLATTITGFLTLGSVLAGVALAGWGIYNMVTAIGRVTQVGPGNQQTEAERTAKAIEQISDARAKARIKSGGTAEETESRLQEYREELQRRIDAADERRRTTIGRSEGEEQRLRREHEEALPNARRMYEEQEMRSRPRRDPRLGDTENIAAKEERRRMIAEEIAERQFPYVTNLRDTEEQRNARLAFIRAQRERLASTLTGRDPGIPLSPAQRVATEELDRLKKEQEEINKAFGGAGPRLSLQGLLPQPQMFQDFAQVGEQLTLKSLERQGEQDTLLAIQRIESIANAMGLTLQVVADRVDISNMFRIMGGTSPNR